SRTIVRADLISTAAGVAQPGTAASASDNTGVGSFAAGDQAVTKDGSVNVRNQPSTSGDVITMLDKGETVLITGASEDADGHTWWPIKTADGQDGWVVQDYLTKDGQ
ncbi:MAG: SH3 domain-containing protein, partial [Thermomicrobiales bacterium]